MARALEREKTVAVKVLLAPELVNRLEATATRMGVSRDEALSVLLALGLAAQEQREREIAALAEEIASTDDSHARASATDRLGEMIFGE